MAERLSGAGEVMNCLLSAMETVEGWREVLEGRVEGCRVGLMQQQQLLTPLGSCARKKNCNGGIRNLFLFLFVFFIGYSNLDIQKCF